MKKFIKIMLLFCVFGIAACQEPEQLKSLVVEFPEPTVAQVSIQTSRSELQYQLPVAELTQPSKLKPRMQGLPAEVEQKVFELLAAIEPPPASPLAHELSEHMEALEEFLGGYKQQMGKLSEEAKRFAEQAEEKASNVVQQLKREYVEHIIRLIEQDELSEDEIKRIEKALIERYHRPKAP